MFVFYLTENSEHTDRTIIYIHKKGRTNTEQYHAL